MNQLEKKFYSRQEIAEALSLNIADSNHFKRNVQNKLMKWRYSFEYSSKGVLITKVPETAEERLSEILIREYGIDIQIDTYSFACFITAFEDIENFTAMPWGERVELLKKTYNVSADERTLRNWCSKLIKTNTVVKTSKKAHWRTIVVNGVKTREWIDGIEEAEQEMREYYENRKLLVNNYISDCLASGKKDYKEIKAEAWKNANHELWNKYGCCYYSCKSFAIGAFDDLRLLEEIQELVREIADKGEEPVVRVNVSISTGANKEFIF